MPSFCVLGCTGFIGRNLVRYLAEQNIDCTSVSRADVDLENAAAVADYFQAHAFDVVVHCAAVGGCRLRCDDDAVYRQNVAMFVNVAAHAMRWHRFVWLSSGAALAAPDTPYGAAKAHCEQVAADILNCQVWRVYGCYGDDEPEHRLMATCRRQGWVTIDHDRLFDFVWVRDLCTLVVKFDVVDGRVRDAVYKTKVALSHVAAKCLPPHKVHVQHTDCASPYVGRYCDDVGRVLGVVDRLA